MLVSKVRTRAIELVETTALWLSTDETMAKMYMDPKMPSDLGQSISPGFYHACMFTAVHVILLFWHHSLILSFYSTVLYINFLTSHPALGMLLRRKIKQRSENEAGKEIMTWTACRTKKWNGKIRDGIIWRQFLSVYIYPTFQNKRKKKEIYIRFVIQYISTG